MPEVKNSLLTTKYTRVFHEDDYQYHAPHNFYVEDLIIMVITRLEHFQRSQFGCRENTIAITKLEETLMWLRKRTMDREQRGVEGFHKK